MKSILLTTLVIFVLLLMGSIAMVDYKSKLNRSFAFTSFTAIFWVLGISLGFYFVSIDLDIALLYFRVSWALGLWIAYFILNFFYFFPYVHKNISPPLWIAIFSYIVVLSLVTAFTPLVSKNLQVEANFAISDEFGFLYPLYLATLLFLFLFALYLGLQKLTRSRGVTKGKLIVVLFGTFSAVLIAMMSNAILPVFGIFILQEESILAPIIMFSSIFYAIQKYRFFNLTTLSLRLFRLVIFLTLAVLVVVVFNKFTETFVGGVLGGIVAILFIVVLNQFLPNFTTKNFRNFRKVIEGLSSKIYYSNSFGTLFSALEKAFLMNMHINTIKLFFITNNENDRTLPCYSENSFTEILEKRSEKILVMDEIEFQKWNDADSNIILSQFNKMEASVCLPLYSEKKMVGLFFLGTKVNRRIYGKDELDELLKFRNILEIVFGNIIINQNVLETNDLLRKLINDKTRLLAEKVYQGENLLQQQSDFMAVTAHEFRTPLSIALFQADEIIENYSNNLKFICDFKVIEKSLNNLKVLTGKLFDVQRYDLNKENLDSRTVNLNKFMGNIYDEFKQILKNDNVEFVFQNRLSKSTFINIDSQKIRQVLNNLLSNAFKFTGRGHRSYIALSIKEERESIYIRVVDRGGGVKDDEKGLIFEKFRSNFKSANCSGLGLGLYIVKKIIELHSGEIWVEDNPGGGSCFVIRLDL